LQNAAAISTSRCAISGCAVTSRPRRPRCRFMDRRSRPPVAVPRTNCGISRTPSRNGPADVAMRLDDYVVSSTLGMRRGAAFVPNRPPGLQVESHPCLRRSPADGSSPEQAHPGTARAFRDNVAQYQAHQVCAQKPRIEPTAAPINRPMLARCNRISNKKTETENAIYAGSTL